MVGRPGKRSEGGRRVLTGYSFPWIPYCEVDSVPFSRSLWSSQGVLLDLTLSPPDSVATEPIIQVQEWSQSGYSQPWVILLYIVVPQIALPL